MILYYMFSVLPKSKCCMHPLYFKVVHSVIMKLRLSLAMKKKGKCNSEWCRKAIFLRVISCCSGHQITPASVKNGTSQW